MKIMAPPTRQVFYVDVGSLSPEDAVELIEKTKREYGMGENRGQKFDALVQEERRRQQKKWGDQSHHDIFVWAAILGEEFGEFQEALLENKFGTDSIEHVIEELVQVAAVCRSIYEQCPALKD
jgi:NTP pyrophosphatase (non-canonical NTP hydrolase)